MIKLIVGNKGSGKTKELMKLANEACAVSKGNVVCVSKGMQTVGNLNVAVRHIDIAEYGIEGYEEFYGFLAGILAGNYDITELFIDGTFKVCGKDYEKFAEFAERIQGVKTQDTSVIFTISCDKADLPESVSKYII